MKTAGLSSTFKKIQRQTNKMNAFSAQQEGHFAAKEKMKILRLQAAKAQFDRQKRDSDETPAPTPVSPD